MAAFRREGLTDQRCEPFTGRNLNVPERCRAGAPPAAGWPYSGSVPKLETFETVLRLVDESVDQPRWAEIASLEMSEDLSLVTLRTRRPMIFIGRRGKTADHIRAGLSDAFGVPVVLKIEEVKEPPHDPPTGGVREPRSPQPDAPTPALTASVGDGEHDDQ